jgi:hypothetical protein
MWRNSLVLPMKRLAILAVWMVGCSRPAPTRSQSSVNQRYRHSGLGLRAAFQHCAQHLH